MSIAQHETISNDDGFSDVTILHYADFTGLAKVVMDFIKGIRVALKKRETQAAQTGLTIEELIPYYEVLISELKPKTDIGIETFQTWVGEDPSTDFKPPIVQSNPMPLPRPKS